MAASKFITPPPLSERISKEEEFFSKNFYLSYSGLNKLLYSPALFYSHYVLKQRDDSYDQNMVEGSLIHCLLLDKENFDDKFVLSPADTPSDSQRDILDSLYIHYKSLEDDSREELHDFSRAILELLQDRNLYQSMKESTRIDKMINETTHAYWEYLKKAEGKLIIDQDTYDFAKSVVDKVTTNSVVMDTMGFFGDEMNGVSCTNEVELIMEPDASDYPFGFRGFVDNLVIDKENKVIRINDLKKTSKTLSSFQDSIEYFNYWAQAALYTILIEDAFLSLPIYDGWTTEFRFIVIDSQMQIAPIKVSGKTMTQWKEKLTDALLEASYHFDNRNFELPYKFLTDKELVI
jgi:hypothetical protein